MSRLFMSIFFNLLILAPSISHAYDQNCEIPVKEIFSKIVSVQKGVSVTPEHVATSELTKYEWSISVSVPGVFVEYLAIINNEQNCDIESFIVAEGEAPKFDYHWEK